MSAWDPRPIDAPLDAFFSLLVDLGVAGQLVLYVGAGLSKADPTAMPNSADLTARAAPILSTRLGVPVGPGTAADTLEKIGDIAAGAGAADLAAVKSALSLMPELSTSPPNFGHVATALLLREGIITVLSVNWDRAIEAGASKLQFELPVHRSEADRRGRWARRMSKIHGCVTDPNSLRLTTTEIAEPESWAISEISTALAAGKVVFIGLGTIPGRLQDQIRATLALDPAAICVVSPSLSSDWAALLPTPPSQHRPTGADEFLDDLARALARLALAEAQAMAQTLAGADARYVPWVTAMDELVRQFGGRTAVAVLNWIRAGAGGLPIGSALVGTDRAARLLVAVAGLLAQSGSLLLEERNTTLVVKAGSCYVEFGAWPGTGSDQVVRAETVRVNDLRSSGLFSDPAAPIAHLCLGQVGPLPDLLLESDLVGRGTPASLVSGPTAGRHLWVPVDSFIEGVFEVAA